MSNVLATRWSDIGERIMGLAESIPEESYDYRPVPEVRSVAEALRHVAFWNDYLRDTLRGGAANGDTNELSADDYPTRTEIIPALRASFADVRSELTNGDGEGGGRTSARELDLAVSYIEHVGEHYGQLVVYARLCGVIPPASLAGV